MKRTPIEKITILMRTESQRELLINKVNNLPCDPDKPIQFVISEQLKARGLSQNSYYWLRLNEIASQAWSSGRQYDSDVWHHYCRRNVMPDMVENKEGEMVSKWIDTPDGHSEVISTAQLSKKQFAEYTEMCVAMGASLGVMFSANLGDKYE